MAVSVLRATHSQGSDALRKYATEWLRHFLLFLQDAHPAKLLVTHDAFVGIVGVVASAWDVSTMWRKLSPPEKPLGLPSSSATSSRKTNRNGSLRRAEQAAEENRKKIT
mmetsp:Transcript_50958/g.132387  ORF Transcript_50958/g.132387 Transcript_50958/m.132387 type:complete len:109 (+) Transcript_50958:1901-2227(+)